MPKPPTQKQIDARRRFAEMARAKSRKFRADRRAHLRSPEELKKRDARRRSAYRSVSRKKLRRDPQRFASDAATETARRVKAHAGEGAFASDKKKQKARVRAGARNRRTHRARGAHIAPPAPSTSKKGGDLLGF